MNINKDILGKFFFTLSIIFLIYLLITPLNHLICQIDEYFMDTVLMLPLPDIITVTATDVHPPLYYVMAKATVEATKFLGIDFLYSLKLLSVSAFIILLIISATKIRKDYGWFAAGLFAFSLSIMNEFSRYYLIGRMYSWTVLFILIAFLEFRNIINKPDDKKSWILLTLFTLLGAYTHYFAAISSICLYLILLIYLFRNRKSEIKNWFISVVLGILIYLPWVPCLINQLKTVHNGFWISEITLKDAINFFGYYAYNDNVAFAVISIIILAVIILIYVKNSSDIDKNDNVFILSAISVYLGTIILGISISFLFRPILDTRYLMPCSCLLWLAIAIILSKLENRKIFLISLALICILLLSGVANTINTYNNDYQNGIIQKEYFDNITNDDNAILIITTKNDTLYMLDYANQVEMYTVNASHVFGVSMNRLHEIYDFKNINEDEFDDFIANNSDKNIYVISWQEPKINSPVEVMDKEVLLYFTKVNMTQINSTSPLNP